MGGYESLGEQKRRITEQLAPVKESPATQRTISLSIEDTHYQETPASLQREVREEGRDKPDGREIRYRRHD